MSTRLYDDLLEEAANKLDLLRKKVRNLARTLRTEEIVEKWNEEKIDDKEEIEIEYYKDVTGVDGGNYSISTLAFELYIVKAYGIRITVNNENKYSIKEERKLIDIDLMIPPVQSEDRENVYRDIMEIKNMVYGLKNSDITLADGSVESLITRPTHLKLDILDKSPPLPCKDLSAFLNDNVFLETPLAVKKEIERLEETDYNIGEKEQNYIIGLEVGEKLYSFLSLIEILLENPEKKLLFLTKTGRTNKVFKKPLPDQYVLSLHTTSPGYLLETGEIQPLSSIGVPKYCGLREKTRKIGVLRGFIRLEPFSPVYRIEILGEMESLEKENPKRLLKETLLKLSPLSTNGYPHPLYLAHQRAHIEKRAAQIIVEALGFEGELTGRESLERI